MTFFWKFSNREWAPWAASQRGWRRSLEGLQITNTRFGESHPHEKNETIIMRRNNGYYGSPTTWYVAVPVSLLEWCFCWSTQKWELLTIFLRRRRSGNESFSQRLRKSIRGKLRPSIFTVSIVSLQFLCSVLVIRYYHLSWVFNSRKALKVLTLRSSTHLMKE